MTGLWWFGTTWKSYLDRHSASLIAKPIRFEYSLGRQPFFNSSETARHQVSTE